MVVIGFLTVITQKSHLFSDGRIIACDHPSFTGRHIHGGVERETSRSKASYKPSIYCGCMLVRRIFDEHNGISLRKLLQALHITWMTIEMHRYNCLCAARQTCLYLQGIHRI